MDNLKQIRFLTENYSDLQGLKHVPLGIVMLGMGVLTYLSRADLITGGVALVVIVALVFIALAAMPIIERRYESTYGNVQSRKSGVPDWVWAGFGIGISLAEMTINPPLSPTMLLIAAYFANRWYASDGLLPHNLPLAIAALIGTAFPLVLPTDDRSLIFSVILGAMLVIVGLLDHQVLTRKLSPPQDESA